MRRNQLPGKHSPVVICLESSTELWKRLYGIAKDQGHWEVRVARTAHANPDIATLCHRHAPTVLVVEEASLDVLSMRDLGDLIDRRDLRILVFSSKTDDFSYDVFFRRGCAGVLFPDAADVTLRRALRAILEGELWLPRRVLSKLALVSSRLEAGSDLTKREAEILAMIDRGLSNQQIADRLFISRETVRWHIRGLYAKSSDAKRIGARRAAPDQGNLAAGQR